MQLSWNDLKPTFKIDKPIRLIELFAGYGSQNFALKYLGANYEHYKICEWAMKSIQAYNDAHIRDYTDYTVGMTDDEVLDALIELGVSANYNEPCTRDHLKRLDYRTAYSNIKATNNLVNVQKAKGKDFEIVDRDAFTYLLTYSFPCQDLSIAGKMQGMSSNQTRSGMLWEVERILKELKEEDSLPQVLLMENVVQVHGLKFHEDFMKWKTALEDLGYTNFEKDLIATDYGIPQLRKRCFMVSILGEYNYRFPQPIPLEKHLSDFLEEEVPGAYRISDGFLAYLTSTSKNGGFPRWKRFDMSLDICNNRDLACTITTREGLVPNSNYIKVVGNYSPSGHEATRIIGIDGVAPTVKGNHGSVNAITDYQSIRKIMPIECARLMGLKDEDHFKIAEHQSKSSLYHLYGDSIVVDVLMAIFKQML